MTVTLTADRAVAVDTEYYWRPMSTCPLSAKVQLLGRGGVAVYGSWDGRTGWWQGWAPLPKRPKEIIEPRISADKCQHAAAGCNYPEGECLGLCSISTGK